MAITMLRSERNRPERLAALQRVRDWACARFELDGEDTVTVAEVACTLPGCPPLETVIAFWTGGRRHHTKVFKPVIDVTEDDLPPRWMKNAIAVPDDYECTCC